ncbi:nitrogen regulation protein NR(II) [Nevskia soli]|uniref:nitrogen regulation protein NR(II) n=1 Tax=Nevskia soli TaxID=418856 RepID=UPI0004A6E09E|nr:nitrogen regulation protein NR(II) [Nevskia soli]
MKFSVLNRGQPAAILDGLTTAVITLDHALRITYINSAAESLFGLSRHHALGEALAEAVARFTEHEPRLRRALETGSGFIERELKLHRTGEEPITVDCTVTPLLGGKPGLMMEILALDRHLRISRDELLLTQHQASRELIRGLAHEIKNPLGGIRGAAQLLEREYPDSEHREYTRVIIREADRLQNLVDRLLGPNRLPQKADVNVHQILEHVRQLVEAEAPSGIVVLRDYDPSIPEVHADREQLIQATLNVSRNALQALGAKGSGMIVLRTRTRRQITIGGRRHKLAIQVDIEDNGPGIAPTMMEKIFYPMVTTRAEGTGLGLPIAQYLIHSHGGLIECQSQPGRTVFSMFLPLGESS